jgi:hypothetical protein
MLQLGQSVFLRASLPLPLQKKSAISSLKSYRPTSTLPPVRPNRPMLFAKTPLPPLTPRMSAREVALPRLGSYPSSKFGSKPIEHLKIQS